MPFPHSERSVYSSAVTVHTITHFPNNSGKANYSFRAICSQRRVFCCWCSWGRVWVYPASSWCHSSVYSTTACGSSSSEAWLGPQRVFQAGLVKSVLSFTQSLLNLLRVPSSVLWGSLVSLWSIPRQDFGAGWGQIVLWLGWSSCVSQSLRQVLSFASWALATSQIMFRDWSQRCCSDCSHARAVKVRSISPTAAGGMWLQVWLPEGAVAGTPCSVSSEYTLFLETRPETGFAFRAF